MGTIIGNAAEAASRSPQPQAEGSRSGGVTNRNLTSDEQAFAAALKCQPARTEKAPQGLLGKLAGKPPTPELQPTGQRGEIPAVRPTDVLSVKDENTISASSLIHSENLITMPLNSATTALSTQGMERPAPSLHGTAMPPRPPALTLPTTNLGEDAIASRAPTISLTAKTEGEPTRRTAESKPADNKADPLENAALALGDSILRSLQGKPEPESASMISPATPDTRLGEITEKLVSRMLVADRSAGIPEVHITLNESFLNGAEVRVRQDSGQIVVEFTSPNLESQSFLRERGNDLQQALQERLGGEVRVEIRSPDTGRENSNGQSRQHRSVQDEWDTER